MQKASEKKYVGLIKSNNCFKLVKSIRRQSNMVIHQIKQWIICIFLSRFLALPHQRSAQWQQLNHFVLHQHIYSWKSAWNVVRHWFSMCAHATTYAFHANSQTHSISLFASFRQIFGSRHSNWHVTVRGKFIVVRTQLHRTDTHRCQCSRWRCRIRIFQFGIATELRI